MVTYGNHNAWNDELINTADWSQNFTFGRNTPAKTISIYSDQEVLVRFDYNADPIGDRTICIRAGQSKAFDRTTHTIYLTKRAGADPDATVDIEGLF